MPKTLIDSNNLSDVQDASAARSALGAAANLVPTAVKTSAYTAAANEFVKTDATSGNIAIALPPAPADKTRIAVKMIAVSGTNRTLITTGSTDVLNRAGGNKVITLSERNHAATFQYESATGIWNVISSDLPLSQLDIRNTSRNAIQSIKLHAPLTADTALLVGGGTVAFSRSFNSSVLLSTGLYGDYTNTNPAFTFDPVSQGTRMKLRGATLTNLIVGTSATAHRDLTQAEWVKTICTAAKTQTGVDGVANSCSSITATADGATCLYSITTAAAARTFSAFVKRVAGNGRVAITRDGGTTYQDITAQCTIGSFTRVSLTTSDANPTVGFWLEKSGTVIAVDAANDTNSAIMYDPCIVRSQNRNTDSLAYNSFAPAITPATGRYYMSAEAIVQGTNSTSLKLNDGTTNNEFSIALNPSSNSIGSYVRVGNVLKQSNTTANTTARVNLSPGARLKFGLVFGISQMSVLVNDQLHYYWDQSNAAAGQVYTDPASLSSLVVAADADLINVKITEIIGNNLMLVGDSMTANTYFHEMFRNELNPLDWTVYGRGVSSTTITDTQARISTDITPYYWPKANRNVMLLRIGTNSLANNISAATCLTQMQSLVDAILAAQPGWRIKLVTVVPSRTNGLTNITAANFTIQANLFNAGLYSITGIDGVIDLTVVPESLDVTNTAYFAGDGIHPIAALNNLFKPILLKNIW